MKEKLFLLLCLVVVMSLLGNEVEAPEEYERALGLKPGYPYALNNLAIASSLAYAEEAYFEHAIYGKVLSEFLEDGWVDYAALKKSPSLLDKYLKEAAELEPEVLDSMERNEKIAFYVNLYNAITLKVITEHYPIRSIKDIPGAWDRLKFEVAGRELTLNQIEHGILRKEFKEPRVHFALVCASKSCPKLAGEPFTGERLSEELDNAARRFINSERGLRIDRDKNIVYLSSIFKWFRKDFGDVVELVSKYLPEDDAEFIRDNKPKVKYLYYDWSLNDKYERR